MADYVAVSEAMRIAAKQTSLLREVMKMRAENAASAPQAASAPGNNSIAASGKKSKTITLEK